MRPSETFFIPYILTDLHKTLKLRNGTSFSNVGIVYGLESFARKTSRFIPRKSKLSCSCNFSVDEAMEVGET